jgi:hypothetical protein
MIKGLLKFIIQNGAVELCIHPPLNPSGISNAFLEHTAPHHYISTSKLHCALNQPIT